MKERATGLRSPFLYFGGKDRLVSKILPLFPPHRVYVEPFGGAASLLLAKEPSLVEVYNDLDGDVVNFFRVLRDPKLFTMLYRTICLTPYSRLQHKLCIEQYLAGGMDPVTQAWCFFVRARQTMSGQLDPTKGWGFSVTGSSRGMSQQTSAWLSAIERLPKIVERIQRVEIENVDFRRILDTYDTSETLFYCDPPFIHSTRKGDERYNMELTDSDHWDLVSRLLNLKGKVILSGYAGEVHSLLEQSGWTRYDFVRDCAASCRTRRSGIQGEGASFRDRSLVESVWVSP